MRYLVFTNTPAHVHLYRHIINDLQEGGHAVRVLARDYSCTVALAEYYDLPYETYGSCNTSKASLVKNLPAQNYNSIKKTLDWDPDLVFGMGAYAAIAGAVARAPTILVLDSEPTKLDHAVSCRLAQTVLTPDSFRRQLPGNHYVFPGFKECAYLHPDVFEPETDVRQELGVEGDFVIVRLNAFGSHHDIDAGGFTTGKCRQLITDLAEHATVLVSNEGRDVSLDGLPCQSFDLHPARIHDALAAASLLVADSQTMVTEAALLGTPAIRSNSFVGDNDMGNFVELENRNLVANIQSFETVRERSVALLRDSEAKSRWKRRQQKLFDEKVNVTRLLVKVAKNHEQPDDVNDLSSEWSPPNRTRDQLDVEPVSDIGSS